MQRLLSILKSSSFRKRLLSGIVLVLLAVFVLTEGGLFLLAVTFLLSVTGTFELCRVAGVERSLPGAAAYAGCVGIYVLTGIGRTEFCMMLMTGLLMLLLAVLVFTWPRYRTEQILTAFFAVFYTAVMFSYIYRVRTMPDGNLLVWLIVLSSWGSDTCAYAVGMLIGRHHIAPVLSPKKTVEGCIGGIAGAALLGGLFALWAGARLTELREPVFACAFACALSAVLSQVGDFAASAIKREHGIKDYSNLIPGHGGVLDRFDSMLFTAPALYAAFYITQQL